MLLYYCSFCRLQGVEAGRGNLQKQPLQIPLWTRIHLLPRLFLCYDSSADIDKNLMKEYTEGIIKNTKVVRIDISDSEKIKEFIDIMNIH
ncbi:hypothetical protein ABEO83_05340 [Bacillus glycinifermentans]|uniref:hypothetical protein n=1 Tax=Bacillus glycinifermentans TaxID=1664069 RepID=UPI003D23BD66